MEQCNQICVVGVGNIIRSDDGIGPFICTEIDSLKIPDVHTMPVHQLNTEIVEELLKYDNIVIADASLVGKDVDFFELSDHHLDPMSSSHHVNASMIAAIAEKIYGKKLSIHVCAVRCEEFGIGDELSAEAKTNSATAVNIITDWLANLN